jgi:putative flavoprotein involved in K+ transport
MQGRSSPGANLVRVKPKDLIEAGVQRVPRGRFSRAALLEDGVVLEVATSFGPPASRDFRWIRLPVFDDRGEPIHHRGVVQTEPGLYFIGLPFQSSVLSGQAAGAGADARYILKQILLRARGTGRIHEGRAAGRKHHDTLGL